MLLKNTHTNYKDFFLNVDRFLTSLLTLLQYCFCFFMVWFWALRHVESLAPLPGTDPHTSCIGRRSLNHRTAREVTHKLNTLFFIIQIPKAPHYYTSFTF